jgi:fibronectin-binding autotransporter adhesin
MNTLRTSLLAAACVATASAQTPTSWTGGAGTSDWNTAGNWSAGVPNGNFTATFNTAGAKSVNVSSAVSVSAISLGNATQNAAVEISGSLITFDTSSSNNLLTNNTAGQSLTINNNIHLVNGQTGYLNMNIPGSSTQGFVVLNGSLSSDASRSLRKVGAGTLTLNGNNSGVQTQTVSGWENTSFLHENGTVVAGHNNALGSGRFLLRASGTSNINLDVKNGLTIANGLVFDHQGTGVSRIRTDRGATATFSTNSIAGASPITISNNGTGTAGAIATIRFTGNALAVTNTVDVANAIDRLEFANATGTQAWSGAISGAGGLIKSGAGSTTLSGNNSYAGTTQINAGTLLINGVHSGAGAVTVAENAALGGIGTIASAVTFDAGADFVFNTSGPLIFNGSTVSFGGFGVENIVGLSSLTSLSSYVLMSGTSTFDFANVSNIGAANAFDLGNNIEAYFTTTANSLSLTVIPEPSAFAAIAGLGVLGLAATRRRRRA